MVIEPLELDTMEELPSIDTVLSPINPNPADDVFGEPGLGPMDEDTDHVELATELDTSRAEFVVLSDDLEAVFAQLLLPEDLPAISKHALRTKIRDTRATDNPRKQPAYVFDSLAQDALDNIPGHFC